MTAKAVNENRVLKSLLKLDEFDNRKIDNW